MTPATCTMKLTAREGTPLTDESIARTVIATAHAIAERTGVELQRIDHDDNSLTVTLATDRLAGLGFMAELRRLTNAWHAGKVGSDPTQPSLWGNPPRSKDGRDEDDDDDRDPWSTPFDAWDDE